MGNKVTITQLPILPSSFSFVNKKTARMDSTTDLSEGQHLDLLLKKQARDISSVMSKIPSSGIRKDHQGFKWKSNKIRSSLVAITSGEELDVSVDLAKVMSNGLLTTTILPPTSSPHDTPVAHRDGNSIITIAAYTLVAATTDAQSNDGAHRTIVSFGPDRKITMHRPPTPSPPSLDFDTTDTTMLDEYEEQSWVEAKLNECFVSGKSDDDDYFVGHISEPTPSP